jgi:hypothetical protein
VGKNASVFHVRKWARKTIQPVEKSIAQFKRMHEFTASWRIGERERKENEARRSGYYFYAKTIKRVIRAKYV